MDWSTAFEDSGAEEGTFEVKKPQSRMTFLRSIGENRYTPMVAYLFTVNYILGVGCLGMPYAIYQAGIMLSSVLIISCSYISYLTVMWVASASHLSSQHKLVAKGNPFRSPVPSRYKYNTKEEEEIGLLPFKTVGMYLYNSISSHSSHGESDSEMSAELREGEQGGEELQSVGAASHHSNSVALASPSQSPTPSRSSQSQAQAHLHSTPSRMSKSPQRSPRRGQKGKEEAHKLAASGEGEPEVAELVDELLGPSAKLVYQFALSLLTYTGLVAYTQVFVQSFRGQISAQAPLWVPTVLFACCVVPLSCLNLEEQVWSQVAMSILRFVSLAVLLLGMLVAIAVEPTMEDDDSLGQRLRFDGSGEQMPWANFGGFGLMFSTAVFSQLFQHSVPGLVRPLQEHHRIKLPQVFGGALATTCFTYIVTGIAACYHLGSRIEQSINLNFVNFSWGTTPESPLYSTALACSMVVVLFPALDTLSIFPLIATTLGSNMHASFPTALSGPVDWLLPLLDHIYIYMDRMRDRGLSVFFVLVGAGAGLSEVDGEDSYDSTDSHTTATGGSYSSPQAVNVNQSQGVGMTVKEKEREEKEREQMATKHSYHQIQSHSAGHSVGMSVKEKEREQKEREQVATKYLWRLVAALPPVALSLVVTDLVVTLQLAGICGIVVALIVPALLQIRSQALAQDLPPVNRITPYGTFLTSGADLPYLVVFVGAGAFIVCVLQMAALL